MWVKLRLRRAHARAETDDDGLGPMRAAMERTDAAFVTAGFGHLVATLPDGTLGMRFSGNSLPPGLSRYRFLEGPSDSDAPENETHHVPLRYLSPERRRDMAAHMLTAPARLARHTSLEAWGERGTGSGLGATRETIAQARAAPPPLVEQLASRTAIDEEIAARLSNASTKTDFENLSALYAERASLVLTGRADGPDSLSSTGMMDVRRWMRAGDLGTLDTEGNGSNLGRTTREFAEVWLGSDRAERLAWVGVDEATWTAAKAELDLAVEANHVARDLDRGIGGLVRDPLGWGQNEILRPVTDAVLRPIVAADIPIVSDGALMVESAIHGGYDLAESGVDLIGDTATALGHDGVDGAWGALVDGAEELGGDAVDLVTTQGAIALNAGVDAIEQLTDQVDRRGLGRAIALHV